MTTERLSIPELRTELLRLADNEGAAIADELRALVAASFRKPAVRKAPRKLPRLTPELAASIRDYAAAAPAASQLEIANRFNVNPGRVSEALNHLR